MNCRHCGAENNDQARFCQNCGKGLAPEPLICTACQVSNSPDARFCKGCGASLGAASSAPDRPTQDPVIPVIPVPTPPKPQPKPRADPVPGHSAGNKVAAVCIWIVCAAMVVVALTASGPPQDELHACIAAGGSGSSCSSGALWSKVVLVLAFFGAGLGGKFWIRR